MLFRLARMLGKTVNELSGQLDYPELLRWVEFLAIEPDPEWRADARAAQICATLANIDRDPKQRAQPYEIADFLLKFKEPPEQVQPAIEGELAQPEVQEAAKPQQNSGAKIAPETLTWLFAQSRKGKKPNGNESR